MSTIPHRITQTWKTTDVPEKWKAYQKSWQQHHSDWDYRLMTDEDNREFVAKHYPEYLETYDALPYVINRVDYIRYMYMDYWGGFYADLDSEALKPLRDLCNMPGAEVILASPINTMKFVECAVMGSVAGHPLWREVLNEVDSYMKSYYWKNIAWRMINKELHVLSLTGPMMLGRVLRRCWYKPWFHTVWLLPKETFYPIQWYHPDREDISKHQDRITRDTYAVHHIAATWLDANWERRLGDMSRSWDGRLTILLIILNFVIVVALALHLSFRGVQRMFR